MRNARPSDRWRRFARMQALVPFQNGKCIDAADAMTGTPMDAANLPPAGQ